MKESSLYGRIYVPRFICLSILFVFASLFSYASSAQVAPSHDPSRVVRNVDGRYWIFTTGDGVWAMSSSNANFTDWRAESPVFPIGTWPSWINNYVTGFNGFFWAPDVINVNGQYRLYYSCAGQGAAAAIGLATATNLAGPWTDQGLVVAGNNAIDPAPLVDGSNQWLAWGNWQTGIDLLQLNTSSGKPLNSTRWDLVPGQVEAPYLLKNGSYYYLFFQRGLCCNGVNSTYYTVVGRSTSITGPYLDKTGANVLNGGGSVFLPNRDGRYIGPGHVGYGEGKLTYHFYDGNDNGAPKLRVTTLSFSNGWPVAAGVNLPAQGGALANGTYRLRNRTSGKYLDTLGATADGSTIAQWASSSSNNQRWVLTSSSGYWRLRAVTGGKYLDSVNQTADGSLVGQWADSPNFNQQWTVVAIDSYYKILNRANGKALDTGGQTGDGAVIQFWYDNISFNQQWAFEFVSSSTSTSSASPAQLEVQVDALAKQVSVVLPTPAAANVAIVDKAGIVWAEEAFTGASHSLDTANIPAGRYVLRVIDGSGRVEERQVLIKR